MISSGILNKRITIQRKTSNTPANNLYGEESYTWTTFAQMWASVEPVQGREFWAQQQVQSEISIRVRTRYLSGVLPDMRIVYGSRTFTIKSVIDYKEQHIELQLMCSEGVENA